MCPLPWILKIFVSYEIKLSPEATRFVLRSLSTHVWCDSVALYDKHPVLFVILVMLAHGVLCMCICCIYGWHVDSL